jgi:hypothetical protein
MALTNAFLALLLKFVSMMQGAAEISHALSLAEALAKETTGEHAAPGHKIPANWWAPILKHGSTACIDDSASKAFEKAFAGLNASWDHILNLQQQGIVPSKLVSSIL